MADSVSRPRPYRPAPARWLAFALAVMILLGPANTAWAVQQDAAYPGLDDPDPAVRRELSVNGGQRVPVVVFLSEDFYECGRYGDRTLSTYRQMAASSLGAACPTGAVPAENNLLDQVTAEWLVEFERVQLMLRLSSRLRGKHGD